MMTLGEIFSDSLLPFWYPLFSKFFFGRQRNETRDGLAPFMLTNVCASRITS